MKRSEALFKIEEALVDECGLDFLCETPSEVANIVLTTLEQAGMLPPIAVLNGLNGLYRDNAWEPEDG